MFNKKNENGNSPTAPVGPPQMRKPASIAPLPPKRRDVPMAPPVSSAPVALSKNEMPASNATFIGSDIKIMGSIISSGEVVIEGTVEGDVRANKITVKNSANIIGELASEELIIHGRVNGVVRGLKILLASDCILDGDILHETLSIESGAQFEGSCKRSDNPLADAASTNAAKNNSAIIKPLAAIEEIVEEIAE